MKLILELIVPDFIDNAPEAVSVEVTPALLGAISNLRSALATFDLSEARRWWSTINWAGPGNDPDTCEFACSLDAKELVVTPSGFQFTALSGDERVSTQHIGFTELPTLLAALPSADEKARDGLLHALDNMDIEIAYLSKSGRCPVCSSEDIEGRDVNIDGDSAAQVVQCNHCEASWVDCYKLVGMDIEEMPGAISEDPDQPGMFFYEDDAGERSDVSYSSFLEARRALFARLRESVAE